MIDPGEPHALLLTMYYCTNLLTTMYYCMYVYIYIYIAYILGDSWSGGNHMPRSSCASTAWGRNENNSNDTTPNPPTNIVDFGGFDSSIILNLRGGILMSIGIS